jgi:hypothetical protein
VIFLKSKLYFAFHNRYQAAVSAETSCVNNLYLYLTEIDQSIFVISCDAACLSRSQTPGVIESMIMCSLTEYGGIISGLQSKGSLHAFFDARKSPGTVDSSYERRSSEWPWAKTLSDAQGKR